VRILIYNFKIKTDHAYTDVNPAGGKISIHKNIPNSPRVIPPSFIRGDGTGCPDLWAASVRVFDAAVQKAYGANEKSPV